MTGRKSGVPLEERFWAKVSKSDDCWLWMGSVNNQGYPKFDSAWRDRRESYAHRFSWALANGEPVPPGMNVLHSCDVPLCVRPDHLFLGTHADNMHDMYAKGRRPLPGRTPHLSREEVIEIRRRFLEGESVPQLSVDYKVTKRSLYAIVSGASWKEFKLNIPQDELVRLCEQWEPEASSSPISYRRARCNKCGAEMTMMFHCWVRSDGWKKECHLCFDCGKGYM